MAGDGQEGSDDGDAMEASFSFPGGIALYYDSSEGQLGGENGKESFVYPPARTKISDGSMHLAVYPRVPSTAFESLLDE